MSGSFSKVPLILIFFLSYLNPVCSYITHCNPFSIHAKDQSTVYSLDDLYGAAFFDFTASEEIQNIRDSKHPFDGTDTPVFFFESACMVSLLFTFSILYSLRKYLVNKNNWDTLLTKVCVQSARVCLKKAFRSLHVPLCGRFCLNEGGVAGYGD